MVLPLYKDVDLSALVFEPMVKENTTYVVPLASPLRIQTPVMTLSSPLVDEQSELLPFVYLTATGPFLEFLKKVETMILDTCLANKKEYFRKALDDDALRNCHKSFFRGSALKVRVPRDVVVFEAENGLPIEPEAVVAGARVRVILSLHRICFGKTEFGAVFRAEQMQLAPTPACLIQSLPEDEADDDDVAEFL